MFENLKTTYDLRGTPEYLQRAILNEGVDTQDLILAILQPEPMLGGALTIGIRMDEVTPRALRLQLQKHFVRPDQARLIVRYYRAEYRCRRTLPLRMIERQHARVFIVQATRLTPDVPRY